MPNDIRKKNLATKKSSVRELSRKQEQRDRIKAIRLLHEADKDLSVNSSEITIKYVDRNGNISEKPSESSNRLIRVTIFKRNTYGDYKCSEVLYYPSMVQLRYTPPSGFRISSNISLGSRKLLRGNNGCIAVISRELFSKASIPFVEEIEAKYSGNTEDKQNATGESAFPLKEDKSTHNNNPMFQRKTYTFTETEIDEMYHSNPEFANIIHSGKYFYYNGHMVLLHPECILYGCKGELNNNNNIIYKKPDLFCLGVSYHSDGTIIITHAQKHEQAYDNTLNVIPFIMDASNENPSAGSNNSKYGKRSPSKNKSTGRNNDGNGGGNDNTTFEAGGGHGGGSNFNLPPINILEIIIDEYIKRLNLKSKKAFASSIGLNEESLRRIYSRSNSVPSLQTVVAVCLGLHMEPWVSPAFFILCGQTFTRGPLCEIYRYLINVRYACSIESNNHFLIEKGYKALTNKL